MYFPLSLQLLCIPISANPDNSGVNWMEPVAQEEYQAAAVH